MNKIYKENILLFTAFLIIFLSTSILSLVYGRSSTHIFINQFHTPFLDDFMRVVTWFGDGMILVLTALILLFIRIRYGLVFLSSFLLSSILVQLLKHTIFSGMPRPIKFFEGSDFDLHIINGMKYHYINSFPSGHAATAFALFFGFALLVKNRLLKFVFLILASIVAFSRVYLSQHFLVDIIFGALAGVICIVISYICIFKLKNKRIDQPLFRIFKKRHSGL